MKCPCTSNKVYAECCQPILDRTRPAMTAEELMRSRYTAYAKKKIEYLRESTAPESRKNFDEKSASDWATGSEWLGLDIVSTEAGTPMDTEGKVEFIARYKAGDNELEHHEYAEFRREGGVWYFVDGKLEEPEPITRETPKVGRNDPCPCGSGKKHKKCCG
ncbi:MAG: YchJ family protein [Planctomycetota bacterium]